MVEDDLVVVVVVVDAVGSEVGRRDGCNDEDGTIDRSYWDDDPELERDDGYYYHYHYHYWWWWFFGSRMEGPHGRSANEMVKVDVWHAVNFRVGA